MNFIIFIKTNQWLKIVLFLLSFLIIILFLTVLIIYLTGRQKGSNFYVNSNYNGLIKFGSKKYPLTNIQKTLELALKKEIKNPVIHIANGEYFENINIPKNYQLLGEDKLKTTIKQDSASPIITMQENSIIKNISLIGGSAGILSIGNATIDNCLIKNFTHKGIDANASNSKITISNSEIIDGNNKGIYIQKDRQIEIFGNKIYNNKGEGLDIRNNVSGTIFKNEIHNNSESGIELLVGRSSLEIKENTIWDNGSNGITCQYYEDFPEKGRVLISSNNIKSNSENYTISVKSPSGGKGRPENYWKDSITITKDNILEGEIKNRSLEISN